VLHSIPLDRLIVGAILLAFAGWMLVIYLGQPRSKRRGRKY